MNWNNLVRVMDRTVTKTLDASEIYYVPSAGGAPILIEDGIFDEKYQDAPAGEVGFAAAGPMVFCRLEDLPEDPDQQVVGGMIVNGVNYRIARIKKDGQGGVRLLLHRKSTPYTPATPAAPEIEVVED